MSAEGDTNLENTLAVIRDGVVVHFPVSEAAYNWKREEHGVELTLSCRTAELPDQYSVDLMQ